MMRRTFIFLAFVGSAFGATPCDRACLKTTLNQYLNAMVAHPPPAERVVPKAEQLSREDLIAITSTYFDGLSAHDGKQILAHPGCIREENGVRTTQRALQGGGCPTAPLKAPWPTFLP